VLRDILFLTLGLGLLAAGVYLTHTKVIAIQVGAHTSRLVGILCAILAYYYLRHSFSLRVPQGAWNAQKLLETVKVWLPPVVLFGAAGFYAITIFKNWRSEFIELISSTAWLVVVVGLIVAARYVLSQ
jgi:hypothetical protein